MADPAPSTDIPWDKMSSTQKLGVATDTFQFSYFLLNTEHSLKDYKDAGGVVPASLSGSVKNALPWLIDKGIINKETVLEQINAEIDKLQPDAVFDMLEKMDVQTFSRVYNGNEQVQAALATVFENTFNNTKLSEALKLQGVELDLQHTSKNGNRATRYDRSHGFTIQSGVEKGQSLLDQPLSFFTEKKLEELFGKPAAKDGETSAPGSFKPHQIRDMIGSLPAAQIQEVINQLGTGKDGKAIEGFDKIHVSSTDDRRDLIKKLDDAIGQRASTEFANKYGDYGGILNSFMSSAGGGRDKVLIEMGVGFADKLHSDLQQEQKKLVAPSAEEAFKRIKERVEKEPESVKAMLANKMDVFKDALKKTTENSDSLKMMIDMIPEGRFNDAMVDGMRNALFSGDGFLGKIGTLIKGFLKAIAPALEKVFGIDIEPDIVQARAEQQVAAVQQDAPGVDAAKTPPAVEPPPTPP